MNSWPAAAAERAIEGHREEVLAEQASAWASWTEQVGYVGAMRVRLDEVAPERLPDVMQWLDWCDAHLTEADPMALTKGMPEPPQLTREFLQPHLRDWSGEWLPLPARPP